MRFRVRIRVRVRSGLGLSNCFNLDANTVKLL
jgi:hypothetical protein